MLRRPTVLLGLGSVVFLLFTLQTSPCAAQAEPGLGLVKETFADPPDDSRIMMRWWWFGPAVSKPEIKRELEEMKSVGIGGVEIATLYPLALDDPHSSFHNMTFLSDEHLDALRFAASEARDLGLRVDVSAPG